jgi:hypothetical protein
MKIKILGAVVDDPEHGYILPLSIITQRGKGSLSLDSLLKDSAPYDPDHQEPLQLIAFDESSNGIWVFRRKFIRVEDAGGVSRDELLLRIKHAVLREEKLLARIAREIKAFENMERISSARRERIPEAVRLFVWQRDEGKCVKCGAQERLEFDHIIPLASGGSNTERNIQLLCERCNREKGKNL